MGTDARYAQPDGAWLLRHRSQRCLGYRPVIVAGSTAPCRSGAPDPQHAALKVERRTGNLLVVGSISTRGTPLLATRGPLYNNGARNRERISRAAPMMKSAPGDRSFGGGRKVPWESKIRSGYKHHFRCPRGSPTGARGRNSSNTASHAPVARQYTRLAREYIQRMSREGFLTDRRTRRSVLRAEQTMSSTTL
jgi:hypothetical protein